MRSVSVMLKPSSSLCNLRCKYCFYHSLSEKRASYSHGEMSLETAENVVKKVFEYADGGLVYISFQGGEPLLRGKAFFSEFGELLKKYNRKNSRVVLALQTNGTLIDDEWANFFAKNRYLIGISLDGKGDFNSERLDANGNAVTEKVLGALALLQRYNVDFNILTVVTRKIAENIGEVYDFFVKKGFKYLQFISCLPPFGAEPDEYYMDGSTYGKYLLTLFSRYYEDILRGSYVSVRQLDNLVLRVAGKSAEQCGMNGGCSTQFVIEGDGGVYPCDFYCLDEYLLGNINADSFSQLENSPVALRFVDESLVTEEKCKTCDFYALCKNGCRRERNAVPFCEGYRYFLPKAIRRMQRIVKILNL